MIRQCFRPAFTISVIPAVERRAGDAEFVQRALGRHCPSSDNLRLIRYFEKGGSGSSGDYSLGGLQSVLQAAVCDGGPLDAVSFGEDRLGSSKIDVSGREVVDALVIADVVIMLDEGADLPFEIAGQVIVLEQDAVLEGLVPPFDFPLGLRVIRSAAHMLNALVLEPPGQIAGNVR